MTAFDLDEYVYDALRGGASGFLLKDAAAHEPVHAIRVIAVGEALHGPVHHTPANRGLRLPPRQQPAALAGLTRERDVMRLLAAHGMSNTDIARELVLGDAIVKTHVARIFTKLSLYDQAQAVVLAYQTGLIQPGDRESPHA
jgi:DNA-binding NarL/FixJ family response regulator